MMQNIVRAARVITGSDMANLQVLRDHQLRIAAQEGFLNDFLKFFEVVEGEDCACGAAARSREAIVVHDVRTSPIFVGKPSLSVMLEAGALSVLSIPILAGERLLGMLSVHRRRPAPPDLAKLKRVEWLAQEAARILEGRASPVTLRGIEVLARA